MLLSEIKKTVTVSGGSGFLSIPCWQGEISIINITPILPSIAPIPMEDHIYDIRLVNSLDVDIELLQNNAGIFLSNDKRLTIRGNATLYLETATDGEYEIYVQIIEKS